jgi:microcystin-dependent protein
MGLESATYLDELVAANPLGTDQRKTIDDHVRLIKAVLQASFKKADGVSTWDTALAVDPIDVSNGWIPIKGTILYQGDPADLPSNWQLSDGTNGTKDLRDKFIVAGRSWNAGTLVWESTLTGASTTSGGASGAASITSGSTVVTIQDHTLTLSEIPSHTHFIIADDTHSANPDVSVTDTNYLCKRSNLTTDGDYRFQGTAVSATLGLTSASGSSTGHTHVATTHSHSVNYPSYYTLAYIVRTS